MGVVTTPFCSCRSSLDSLSTELCVALIQSVRPLPTGEEREGRVIYVLLLFVPLKVLILVYQNKLVNYVRL